MSRVLNHLLDDVWFIGYGMLKWSSNLNHLAYADDTIIFLSTHQYSLESIIKVLREYKTEFRQKVNMNKSFFYMHQKASMGKVQSVEKITCMKNSIFRIKYHGCPLSHSKRNKEHFVELIEKVQSKIQA